MQPEKQYGFGSSGAWWLNIAQCDAHAPDQSGLLDRLAPRTLATQHAGRGAPTPASWHRPISPARHRHRACQRNPTSLRRRDQTIHCDVRVEPDQAISTAESVVERAAVAEPGCTSALTGHRREPVSLLGPRKSAAPRLFRLTARRLAENVGSQFLSLRQSFRDQHSPLGFGALKSPITTGFARKPPHCAASVGAVNSLSRPVCLQTSRLRGFSTELVSD